MSSGRCGRSMLSSTGTCAAGDYGRWGRNVKPDRGLSETLIPRDRQSAHAPVEEFEMPANVLPWRLVRTIGTDGAAPVATRGFPVVLGFCDETQHVEACCITEIAVAA